MYESKKYSKNIKFIPVQPWNVLMKTISNVFQSNLNKKRLKFRNKPLLSTKSNSISHTSARDKNKALSMYESKKLFER